MCEPKMRQINDKFLSARPKNEYPFPEFRKPEPIGFFSIDTHRNFSPNADELRYFRIPSEKRFPLNLNEGLSLAIKKEIPGNAEALDNILKFIYDHYSNIYLNANSKPPEIITWRGILRLIMCTPYEYRQDWCLHVTKFKNTFYISRKDTQQDILNRTNETEKMKQMCSWGFKFEQYCLSPSPFLDPDTSAPVDECAEFSCVYRTRLSGMWLLYGAEMDGIVSEQPVQLNYDDPIRLESLKFVEMKVRQEHLNAFQRQNFLRYKTQNWWCQSFLVGIEDLYVGMRNERGLVNRVEHMEIGKLRRMEERPQWNASVCANFLVRFLVHLRALMSHVNCPSTVFEFNFNAKSGRINHNIFEGKTAHSFIPDWYIRKVNETNEK